MFAMTKAIRGQALAGLVLWLLTGALLAGCSGGGTGPAGPTGPGGGAGSTGPGGSTLARSITGATTIVAQTTGVSGGATPTIYFNLVDEKGQPLYGLQPAQVRFAIAKLVPGNNGAASIWQSYINTVEQPSATLGWGTVPTRQATAEAASASGGVFTDNHDGTYSYKLAKSLDAYTAADAQGPAVSYEPGLTHRVGLEVRGAGAGGAVNGYNNGVFSWLPSTGATTNLVSRDIAGNKECDACHAQLGNHGGARNDVQYCVICHNPGTTDAQSGNTLDFKVMIHKIHAGKTLPTVVAAGSTVPARGVGYTIFGFGGSVNNYNTVAWPQDTRNCATCHNASDPLTPDANNYQSVPTSAACGGCHDNANFTTGRNHGPTNQPVTDADCVTCHGTSSTVAGGAWQAAAAHVIPEKVASGTFKYNILSVTSETDGALADGSQLKITFSVTDPTTPGKWYNILTDTPFAGTDGGGKVCKGGGAARLALDVGWSTGDYTNFGSASLPAQPWSLNPITGTMAGTAGAAGCPPDAAAAVSGPDANGVFTLVTSKAGGLPAGIGSLSVVFEGHPAVDTRKAGTASGTGWARIPVTTAVMTVKVNDSKATARRSVVAIDKCDRCHDQLTLHGNNRTDNPQACAVCHNPGATDGGRRKGLANGLDPVDGLYEQPIDFKFMVHAIHGASMRAAAGVPGYVVYGFGGSKNDFTDVGFPGALNDCEMCHAAGTYFPVDPTKVQATTTSNGASVNPSNPNAAAATSPNMAACSACHAGRLATTHMVQNGGSTAIQKDGFGRSVAGSVAETCSICHGPGQTADVKVVHKVASYKYN